MVKSSASETNRNICLLYLKKYEEKDINAIQEMFAEDILLRDWKICVRGKDMALAETQKNFDSVHSIKITVLSVYENENACAAELHILLDDKEELYVMDIITVNTAGKICSVKAFIGRGDE